MSAQPAVLDLHAPRREWLRRKRNRRVLVQKRSLFLALTAGIARFGRGALAVGKVTGKLLALAAALAGACWGGQWAVQHLVDSPRFRVRHIDVTPLAHADRDEVLALAGVTEGDRLLLVDTDRAAARVASHPWVASVRVARQLPSGLRIDVQERRAAALAALGGLYLIDENGRPFKRATMEEAEGLPVVTGLSRAHYAQMRPASEAVLREALAVLGEYRRGGERPALAEIAIESGFGFSLFLLENGAEIRLGRGDYARKLAHLDLILEAVSQASMGGLTAVRIVNLDDPKSGRVPVLLRERELAPAVRVAAAPRPAKN